MRLSIRNRPLVARWSWIFFLPSLTLCGGSHPSESGSPPPGAVSDLRVTTLSDTSAGLAFTQVSDGTGSPANYEIRFAKTPLSWGAATTSTRGTCATPVIGSNVGAALTCTLMGLSPSTAYDFQLVAYRGDRNASRVFGGVSNMANGVTLAATPVVAAVVVTPASASIVAGSTRTLQAVVQDASGNSIPGASVTWSSDNTGVASVNASGVVTAVAQGTTTVRATSSGKSGSSAITVTSPPAGGATLLFAENFEDANLAARGWYDNTSTLLSTAEHITGSASSAQYHFLAGAQTPTTGGSQRHKFTPTSSLYISFYVKYSANWVGSNQAYHPHEFYAMSTLDGDWDGPSNAYLTIYLEHNYQNGGKPAMYMQDNKSINTSSGSLPNNLVGVTENRSVGGCNGVPESNWSVVTCYNAPPWYNAKGMIGPVAFQPNPGPGYKNSWNFVEAYYQLNSVVNGVGQADGVMQYWFNGTLLIDRHDVVYRTGTHPTLQFSQFLIAPYIGDGSPVDQSMFVDNLRVATGRLP